MISKDKLLYNNVVILLFGVFFLNIQGGFRFGLSFLVLAIFLLILNSLLNKHVYKIGVINKMYFALTFMLTISAFYAYDSSYSTVLLIAVYSTNIIMFLLYNYCETKQRLLKVVSCILLISVLFSALNAVMSPIGSRELFYGPVNPVGFAMFICILLSIWMALNKRYIYLVFIPLFLYVLFLTGSQKSILSLFVVFSIYMSLLLYKLRVKLFFRILIVVISGSLLFVTYFSEHKAMQYAFARTSATIESLYTGEKVKMSAGGSAGEGLRPYLKDKGVEYIKKSPIIGFGINNFRPLLKDEVGFETYSHHTPIELAIAVGIFGVFLYYSIFLVLFFRLLRIYNLTKKVDNLFFISSLVGLIIIGLYMQLYFDAFAHIFLIIIYSFIKMQEKTVFQLVSNGEKLNYK